MNYNRGRGFPRGGGGGGAAGGSQRGEGGSRGFPRGGGAEGFPRGGGSGGFPRGGKGSGFPRGEAEGFPRGGGADRHQRGGGADGYPREGVSGGFQRRGGADGGFPRGGGAAGGFPRGGSGGQGRGHFRDGASFNIGGIQDDSRGFDINLIYTTPPPSLPPHKPYSEGGVRGFEEMQGNPTYLNEYHLPGRYDNINFTTLPPGPPRGVNANPCEFSQDSGSHNPRDARLRDKQTSKRKGRGDKHQSGHFNPNSHINRTHPLNTDSSDKEFYLGSEVARNALLNVESRAMTNNSDAESHSVTPNYIGYQGPSQNNNSCTGKNKSENNGRIRRKKNKQNGGKEGTNANVENKGYNRNDLRRSSISRMYTKNPNLGNSNSSIISIPVDLYCKDVDGARSIVDDQRGHSSDLFGEENKNGTLHQKEMLKGKKSKNQIQDKDKTKKIANKQSVDKVVSLEELNDLTDKDPEDIIKTLLKDDECYLNVLKDTVEPKLFVLVIHVLSKVCTAKPSSEKGNILRQASLPMFLDQVFNFVSDFPFTEDKDICDLANTFFENIVLFYDTLIDLMPSAMRIWRTHLIEVEKSVKATIKNLGLNIHPNILVMVKSVLSDINNIPCEAVKEEHVSKSRKKKDLYFPDPVGDFRTVPLFPRPEDVFSEQPFLNPNIVEGPFGNVDQYLDTHFKLLREDFMSPIRQGIRDYKKQCNTKGPIKRVENVRIYRKVKFLHPKTITDKVGYEICFDVDNKITRVNWEFSNRFMFGSLLLFTADHFDTFFLATVANRNVKELESKKVTVELQGTLPNAKSILGKVFVMAESEAYFEPYFHVLKALQRFNNTNFPLSQYIVDIDTRTEPPHYLSPDDLYTISGPDRVFTFTVLSDYEWPTHEDLHLDPSQYEAYKAALTNDLVVIQGPPGTGKTFLGLQIAKTLLTNSNVWNKSSCPILVVCFTNHALDQFLEGLLPVTSKLVRIGGRSKGSELDKFNIRERRREYSYYKKTKSRETRELHLKMTSVFAEMKVHQENLQILDDTNGVISLKTLQLVMADNQINYFCNDDHLMDWLLVGVGSTGEKKIKITVTADRGIVKETSETGSALADSEDLRVRQAFFDTIDLDSSANPPEDTVKVYFACNIKSIKIRHEEIMKELASNRIRDKHNFLRLRSTSDSLGLILKHLGKELLETNYSCSDFEKQRLLEEVILDNLKPIDRWKLYHTWVDILRNGLIVELGNKEAQFREYAFKYDQLRQTDDIEILRTSHVVGTTTTIAAKLQPMLTALAPKIVIVEEAAEVLEAHIIASLNQSCEHLILIGDHKQLRPNVAEVRLARQYHLDVSLFERMVINGMACHTLSLQHRMRPEISQQLVPTIYPTLLDHVSVRGREPIKGMEKNVFFMTHKHFEDDVVEITSKRNKFEAQIILRLAKHLVLQGYEPKEITILATYKGQMYHMKNEIKTMNGFPSGIQITVVDNFQGEENRIILLSLVRSNAINKIGYLAIENRVCVALSRARDGLYIVGNMDNLVASSDIWPNIKNSFQRQAAFGTALGLRCQIHRDQVTSITCAEDFSKVSEGGCSRICGQQLPYCNHVCKSMCHLAQDYHMRYKCKEPCPRILCDDGHQCPKKCFMKCEECRFPVQRDLPCGHTADVPCSLDIRNFKCKEVVEVVVALCKHSVMVPCHSRNDPECNQPCINRLECGHSCDRKCHVDDDAEHTEYICSKACPGLNKDCSEDHKCRLACFEECVPCPVKVQKRLPCGHLIKTVCSSSPSTIICKQKCERALSCGHQCTSKCWEPCDCFVAVEKIVPGCGHTIKVACNQPAVKELCKGRCNVQLACGHPCTKRCKDACSVDNCVNPIRLKMSFTILPCRHKVVMVPCNKSKSVKTMSADEQMQYCAEPCTQELACGHMCHGTCGECLQGRIHKVCDQPCGNTLICGHSCEDPCREVCPPCDKLCRHECKHSKCVRKCGQPCVPCKEPCDYVCPHLKCNKPCGELCDREPCYEDCPKQLDCTHPCVGFCGEPCPPCRQCEPEHFEEFFYTGEETEDDANWVYLEDCKHTFESSGLEYWLNLKQEGREIISKMCPRCKTPIVKVQRFMNLIKSTYIDIQQVKAMCFGKPDDIKTQRLQSLRKIQDIHFEDMAHQADEPDELERLFVKLKDELPEVNSKKKRKVVDAKKVHLLCFETEFFVSLYKRKEEGWDKFDNESKDIISKKINLLTCLLRQRGKKISEQEMKSFELELKRIHRLCDLLTYTSSFEYRMASSHSETKNIRIKAEKVIYSLAVYDEALDNQMITLLAELKKIIKSSTEISSAERAMINDAMGSSFHSVQKTGHWFKCKNGHVYCITECGGAMQEAICPVRGCGERIGGQAHSLLQDQTLASEMDGANFAAWSDQNNMANFGFRM